MFVRLLILSPVLSENRPLDWQLELAVECLHSLKYTVLSATRLDSHLHAYTYTRY